jgi:hypothetical protein
VHLIVPNTRSIQCCQTPRRLTYYWLFGQNRRYAEYAPVKGESIVSINDRSDCQLRVDHKGYQSIYNIPASFFNGTAGLAYATKLSGDIFHVVVEIQRNGLEGFDDGYGSVRNSLRAIESRARATKAQSVFSVGASSDPRCIEGCIAVKPVEGHKVALDNLLSDRRLIDEYFSALHGVIYRGCIDGLIRVGKRNEKGEIPLRLEVLAHVIKVFDAYDFDNEEFLGVWSSANGLRLLASSLAKLGLLRSPPVGSRPRRDNLEVFLSNRAMRNFRTVWKTRVNEVLESNRIDHPRLACEPFWVASAIIPRVRNVQFPYFAECLSRDYRGTTRLSR